MEPIEESYSIENYHRKNIQKDFISSSELRRNSRKSDRKRKGKRKYGF